MKKHIFTILIVLNILLLFSCNFLERRRIEIPDSNGFIKKSNSQQGIPDSFNTEILIYDIKPEYNSLITALNNMDNRITEFRITNTSKSAYLFRIKVSRENIGKIYYLDTRLITPKVGYGSSIIILLTFDKNNDNYSYGVFGTTKYESLIQEVFKGWYRLEKIKNRYGYDSPILLKL